MKKLIGILGLLILCGHAFAKPVDQIGMFWQKLYFEGNLSDDKRFKYQADSLLRFEESPTLFQEGQFIGLIGYQFNPVLLFSLGYGAIPGFRRNSSHFFYEGRYLEQLDWILFNQNNINIASRTRLEERQRSDINQLLWRLREKVSVVLPPTSYNPFRPIFSDEIFISLNRPKNFTEKTFSQNRFLIGLLLPVSNTTNMTIGYINRYIFGEKRDFLDHILLLEFDFDFTQSDPFKFSAH